MNFFPSLVVDKRRFYAQKTITQLFLIFSYESGARRLSASSSGGRISVSSSSSKFKISRFLPVPTIRFRNSTVQMLLIGLCLGVTLGIAFVPFLDSDYECSLPEGRLPQSQQKLPSVPMDEINSDRTFSSVNTNTNQNAGQTVKNLDNLKSIPTNILNANTNSNKYKPSNGNGLSESNKIRRPRYFSTELGLRKKLLAGIIVSAGNHKKMDNLIIGINQTLSQRVDKLLYFVGGNESAEMIGMLKSQGLSGIIEVPNTSNRYYSKINYYKVAWTIIKYFADKFLDSYDYFFIALDNYYVNGLLLMELLNKISVGQDTLWGVPRGDFCSLEHGFIITRRVIQKLSSKLDRCFTSTVHSKDDFVRCILFLLKGKYVCENTVQELTYSTASPSASPKSLFTAITVGPIDALNTFYNIHRKISLSRYAHLQENIRLLQSKIESLFPKIPPKFQGPIKPWPVGITRPFVPKSRFDVISWMYFTKEKMYAKNEISVVDNMPGKTIDDQDISHVIKSSLKYIRSQQQQFSDKETLPGREIFEFHEGYRRFDPIRGMEYILHFKSLNQNYLKKIEKNHIADKFLRIEGVRPISKMELVSMPFVTENRRITIIVPITGNTNLQQVRRFLDRFFDFSVDHKLNTVLVLTLIMSKNENYPSMKKNQKDNFIEEIKILISHYNGKTSTSKSSLADSVKAGYIVVPSRSGSNISAAFLSSADAVIKRIVGPTALILTMDVRVNVRDEFLNRVRMNTVLNWQVYSPIPFVEYNPSIYMGRKKDDALNNVEIEVTKTTGYFDSSIFRFCSFFAVDYLEARKSSVGNYSIENYLRVPQDYSVLQRLFLKSTKLHILRAPEPHLQVPFSFPSGCSSFDDCVQSKWGSRAQLAQVIFNSRDKLSRKL